MVSAPAIARLALTHVEASTYFDSHPAEIGRIRATLAVQNRNLASQTALGWSRPSVTRDELVRSFRRYRDLYASLPLATSVAWARPYVDLMADLMREIRPR